MVKCYENPTEKEAFLKHILVLLFLPVLLAAEGYYAKVEPIDIYTVSSNVQGEVLFSNEDLLGKKLGDAAFIRIDAKTDKADLEALETKISSLGQMIEADKKIVENLTQSVRLKKENYESIKDLSVKSKTQKDAVYFDLVATKNQLLSTKKEIASFHSQLADLQAKKIRLQKSLADKNIKAPGLVLYELFVKKGDVATPAKPLAKVADVSKALLTLYVDADTLEGIENKSVYINGAKTVYKVARITYIADSQNISKYKVQIITDPPKIFSKLVKVELK